MPKAPRHKTAVTYEELRAELDAILLELQRDDLDVDKALQDYQRGLELVRLLEKYLQTAQNTVQKLKVTFDGENGKKR